MMKRLFVIAILIIALMLIHASALAVTRDEAVNWLLSYGQNSWGINLPSTNYGYQCTDFVSGYMNWLVTGDPYNQVYVPYWPYQYAGKAGQNPERWEVINNYAEFIPEPGDIYVTSNGNHVGVVVSSTVNNAWVVDQDGNHPDQGASYHYISWGGYYYSSVYIRFRGFSSASVPPASVTFSFEDTDQMYFMSETTAQFGYIKISTNGNINDVKTSGCELADASGNILATHEEPSYYKNGGILHYFRINGDPNESDICYTLTPGTNYKFRSYVIYNGKKYYSNWRDFKTKGDTPTPIPTSTPEPTAEPTPEPTEEPTPEPTPEPTEERTPEPTEEPTEEPVEQQSFTAQLKATASLIGEDGLFDVTLSIGQNPGFGGITISSDFANMGASLVNTETTGIASNAQIAGASRFSMISADEIVGDGDIVHLTFNANGQENVIIHFDVDKATRADGSLIVISGAEISTWTVPVITDNLRMPGDANEDGIVDIVDAMMVLRYDCGWDVSVNMANSDVNADDFVDIVDAMMILRYDCGWDVELK